MGRRSYQQQLRDQLGRWQSRIDQLSEHMSQASADTRRELDHRIEDLRAKQQAAQRKLKELERSGKTVGESARARAGATRRKVQKLIRRLSGPR